MNSKRGDLSAFEGKYQKRQDDDISFGKWSSVGPPTSDSSSTRKTTQLEMTNIATYDNPGYIRDEAEVFGPDIPVIPLQTKPAKDYEVDNLDTVDVELGAGERDNWLQKRIVRFKTLVLHTHEKYKRVIRRVILLALFVCYNVYFGFAIKHDWERHQDWCTGSRFLTIITAIVYTFLFYFCVIKRYIGKYIYRTCLKPVGTLFYKLRKMRFLEPFIYFVLFGAMLAFVIIDAGARTDRLISFFGMIILIFLGVVFSKHPGKIIWRQAVAGIVTQFVFAIFILRWDVGREIFECLGNKISNFLSYADYGSIFMFGYLATGELSGGKLAILNETTGNFTEMDITFPQQMTLFAFKVLPVILFFSCITSILYFYGVMTWLVQNIGWVLQVTIGTTAAESMNAAGNIFMGMTEAPLLVRPYLALMTKSELHAVMTGGFATIAGSVLAAYISFGVSASHLLSASVMSAPAALAYSKLFYPETEVSRTTASQIIIEKPVERNALEAAAGGIHIALKLVANVAANLIAIIALIYFVDGTLMWFGALVGWEDLSATWIMGKVFMPLAFIMGVPWSECDKVGELIGLKTILNEFVAYDRLGKMADEGLSTRSRAIATYALCGFSNISSIGIQLGSLGAMAPSRTSDFAQVALRAMIAGSAACFLTACIAGALINEAT